MSSDQSFPDIPRDPRAGGPGPSPIPPAMPPTAPPAMAASVGETSMIGEPSIFSSSIVEKKASLVGRLGLVAAAIAVAGGGLFAVTKALSEPAGPSSPTEAIDQFFAAIDDDDLLGMTDVMLPSEREALVEPGLDLLLELQRLELVSADMDLEQPSQFDFTVEGLEIATSDLGTGITRARVVGGTISVVGTTSDLPIGDFITDEIGQVVPIERFNEEIVDFSNDDLALVLVEEDGSWYVSLWYSVAEAARQEAGLPLPDFGNGIIPTGADSPEGAVEAMVDELVDLDVEGAIAMLDPNEFRALHDYAPLFLDDVEELVTEFRAEVDRAEASWSVDVLDLSIAEVRGRTVVNADALAATMSAEGDSFSVDYRDRCLTVVGPQIDEHFCEGDLENDFGVPAALSESYFGSGGITVVERDGRWFVSGMPTVLGGYTDVLASLDRSDLEGFVDTFTSFADLGLGLGLGTGLSVDDGFIEEFGNADPQDDPFDDSESDPDSGFEVLEEVAAEDAALFAPGYEPYVSDPEWYFGFEYSTKPLTYTSAFGDDFSFIEIARFPAGSHETLLSDLEADVRYEPFALDGLPDDATAFVFGEVDVMVVFGDVVVSTWYSDNFDHLVNQLQYLAGS